MQKKLEMGVGKLKQDCYIIKKVKIVKMSEELKQLAYKYFQGKSSQSEEVALYEFISQSEANRAQFRAWEKDWFRLKDSDSETDMAWARLNSKLISHATLSVHKRSLWRRVAAVAAVVAVIAVSAFATWQVASSQPETFYTLTAPEGSKTRLVLPDNSVVWLNAGSTLRYSSNYNHKNRMVNLVGEGYFEVSKQQGADFIVRTAGYDVVVKGTKFDVSAYKGDSYTTTSLLQGHVVINRGEDHLSMNPGEMVTLNNTTGELRKSVFSDRTNAWVKSQADYDVITLRDLARVLSRQYAVNIHIASPSKGNMKLSISLYNKESINEVLSALQRVADLEISRKGNDIYIK